MPDDAGPNSTGADNAWIDGVVIPDDARDLHTDVEAYRRELRAAARRRRIARVTTTAAWHRFGLPTLVVIGSLAVAAAVFGILTVERPQRPTPPPPTALATNPQAPVGAVNGLAPDVSVATATGGVVNIRDRRPALVALVPLHCDCTDLLSTLAAQADEVPVPLIVVAPAAQDAEVAALPGQLHRGEVIPRYDGSAALAAAYGATSSGVTVFTLRQDGTVGYIGHDVDSSVRLEPVLAQMLVPAASLSAA